MRLFAALRLPDDVGDSLAAFLADSPAGHPRWSEPDRWHITLAFYGPVPAEATDDLAARLGRAATRTSPLSLRLAGGGRFGSSVLWVGVEGDRPALTRLAERCAAAGRRVGLSIEDRPFRPHLTVARSRDRSDLQPWADLLAGYAGTRWRADRLCLIRSTLGASPRYDDVATWPLTGS